MMFPLCAYAQPSENIEIFDIDKGKVIKKVNSDLEIQKEVEQILNGITDLYRAFEPIPRSGYMIKFPLEPAFYLENDWYQDYVTEVILIFPAYENPHIMLFNDENKPYFFTIQASVDPILTKLDFTPVIQEETKK